MLKDHVNTLINQRFRCIRLFRRIEPGIGPDHRNGDIRVHFLGVDIAGVDALNDFGNRERSDIADLVRFGHHSRNRAHHGAAFVKARVIGGNIGAVALVAGRMFKLHIGEFGGNRIGRVHITERGGEDDLAAAKCHLGQHTLGIGAFGNVFLIGGFNFVTQSRLDRQTALIVLKRPAAIANRADIDPASLEFARGTGRSGEGQTKAQCSGRQ